MPTVETNGIGTYYERRGTGPPVVFVHGAVLDHGQWDPQVQALAEEYTVVAYDVRGHGRTGGSPLSAYDVGLFAEDLRALVDALDLDRPVVCGLSLGGCIAQVFATRYPDRLSGLVLAGTFGPDPLTYGEWFQRSVLLPATVPFVYLLGYRRVERAMVWLQERVSGEGVSGDYGRVEALREKGPPMETAEFAKVIRALASFDEMEVDLSRVAAPTLVLYGEHEPGFVRRHARRLGEESAATVRAVPGAGHASNLDNPDFFTGAVQDLLAEAT